jgi:WD40 repeat protein
MPSLAHLQTVSPSRPEKTAPLLHQFTVRPRRGVPLRPLYAIELAESVGATAFSPDGAAIAVATLGGPVVILETMTGRPIGCLSAHQGGALSVAFAPGQELLATGGQDGKVRLFSWPSLEEIAVFEAGSAWVEHLAWSAQGRYLASAAGRVARIWTIGGVHRGGFEKHAGTVTSLSWNPNGLSVTSASYGGLNQLQVGRRNPIHQLAFDGPILSLAFSPNRRFIAATTQDTSIRVWEIKAQKARAYDIPGYKAKVRTLAWSPDSALLATGDYSEIALWDFGPKMRHKDQAKPLNGHVNWVTSLKFLQRAEGPRWLLSAGTDGLICGWQPHRSFKPLWKWLTGVPLEQLTLSPVEYSLLAVGAQGYVQAWSLRTN